jgi:AraC-like DNA-binding protein
MAEKYVLTRRLVLAHRMLTDHRWGGVGIASSAYDAGFGDLSYFNRGFKRCYGATPSEVRDRSNRRISFTNGSLGNA